MPASPQPSLPQLNTKQRLTVVNQALILFDSLYVHLPLKESMHAVRPVQRLRLLRDKVERGKQGGLSDREFHTELLQTFNSVRDLHTNYVLPSPFANIVLYLPFLVAAYWKNGSRRYIVSHIRGNPSGTFKAGVEILHWGGIPISRAVEISGDHHAGSNRDARHARGVEGLTMRPLAQSLLPDEEWVDLRYKSIDGKIRTKNFNWKTHVLQPPSTPGAPDPEGALLNRRASDGFDMWRDMVRRATRDLYVPHKSKAQAALGEGIFPIFKAPHDLSRRAELDWPDLPWPDLKFDDSAVRGLSYPDLDYPDLDEPDLEYPDLDYPDLDYPGGGNPVATWASGPFIPGVERNILARGSVTSGAVASYLPEIFDARVVDTAHGTFGYVRIRTFGFDDPITEWRFVAEFVRLHALLPQGGLIVDVRGNGGGVIMAGELLLQTMTPKRIEPERLQFINTAVTRSLIKRHSGKNRPYKSFDLTPWWESARQATQTGATYTQGFPITEPADANAIGQTYHGPVALITDARCYSTTDIFAAGFKDHDIGPVIGTDNNTGAGGANVWTHDLLKTVFHGIADSPVASLPKDIAMRVSIRRTLRVGAAAGMPLEDLGVVPDIAHFTTRKDLNPNTRNADLLDRAGAELKKRRAFKLNVGSVVNAGANLRRVSLLTGGLTRLDVYLDDRPITSRNTSDGSTVIDIPAQPVDAVLRIEGFRAGTLVAARKVSLPL